ncbi:hypothetical protein NPIL_425691 [Nephila pilipes]|uniref:Uncharacterized protein n=1 Tax=Nephila pilipes TaxID=299642 RepID=A0A8X6U9K4_NEPPI|nr:hypothetical protein NPIL_425691 [Nephila pilipes]
MLAAPPQTRRRPSGDAWKRGSGERERSWGGSFGSRGSETGGEVSPVEEEEATDLDRSGEGLAVLREVEIIERVQS